MKTLDGSSLKNIIISIDDNDESLRFGLLIRPNKHHEGITLSQTALTTFRMFPNQTMEKIIRKKSLVAVKMDYNNSLLDDGNTGQWQSWNDTDQSAPTMTSYSIRLIPPQHLRGHRVYSQNIFLASSILLCVFYSISMLSEYFPVPSLFKSVGELEQAADWTPAPAAAAARAAGVRQKRFSGHSRWNCPSMYQSRL